MKFIHVNCLELWREAKTNPQSLVACPNCKYKYNLYWPLSSQILANENFVIGITGVFLSFFVLSSGTAIIYLSKENWKLSSAIHYGFCFLGLSGLIPKLPLLFRQGIYHSWMKFFEVQQDTRSNGNLAVEISTSVLALTLYGALNVVSEVYQITKKTCKYLTKKAGHRVLGVNFNTNSKE